MATANNTSTSSRQQQPPPSEQDVVGLFCDFLENRVATKNFPLLRRMIGDFYAGHDKTLQEFVELSVNLVAVLPFEETDPAKRAFAARVLTHQQYQRRQHAAPSSTSGPHQPPELSAGGSSRLVIPRVFLFFQARVGTKNMHWLARIYCEFCDGRDDALHEFTRIGIDAVCILPVQLHLPTLAHLHWMATPPPPPLVKKRAVSADHDQSAKACKRSHHAKLAAGGAEIATPGSEEDALEAIRADFLRIEATQPWTRVFHGHLASPFDMEHHAGLAIALQQFLVAHGRALWERTFWVPLSKADDLARLVERRKRQESAKKVFMRRVIKPAFKAFGAQFFLDLDARTRRHEGWWYRQSVVELGTLHRAKGLQFCLEYLRREHHERFPNTHIPALRVKARGHHKWSKSMWSSDRAVTYILNAIRRAKDTEDGDGGGGGGDDDDDDDEVAEADAEDGNVDDDEDDDGRLSDE